ncbi:MAG: flotillin family protein [Alphaproteobacteria bacterium]
MWEFLIPVIAVVVGILLVMLILMRMWRRATREVSLVRTGSGGRKVIMDGGCIVLPVFHEISTVNMKTLRLEIRRSEEAAMITKDRMRVDVGVEFYVRVNATEEGVSKAAQTLGDKTFNVEALRDMIEGKLVDGLRSVAARMTMDELHENRSDFVQEVQNGVNEDLAKNGLELESVSLTALDQTPFEALDENNAFNAVGMRKLAEVIAKSKKERAEIDADADVAVRMSAMDAERRKIDIERAEEQARIEQVQQLQTLRAAQEAEIAKRQEDSARLAAEARIQKEREVRAAEIARERAIREAEIQKDRELEVAEQEKQIIVAQKSEEESRARASADAARAEAVKATEAVVTAKTVAEAERTKQVALIEATREAEREATRIRVSALAEREAAADRAEAVREEAQAEADSITIRAEAKKTDLLAQAEGQRAIIDAENVLSAEIIQMKIELEKLKQLPEIIAQMVKPAEKIESIRIHQVTGLGGSNGSGAAAGAGDKPAVNQAMDSILGMALQLPAMRKLGEELGFSMDGGLAGVIEGAVTDGKANGAAEPAPPAKAVAGRARGKPAEAD